MEALKVFLKVFGEMKGVTLRSRRITTPTKLPAFKQLTVEVALVVKTDEGPVNKTVSKVSENMNITSESLIKSAETSLVEQSIRNVLNYFNV